MGCAMAPRPRGRPRGDDAGDRSKGDADIVGLSSARRCACALGSSTVSNDQVLGTPTWSACHPTPSAPVSSAKDSPNVGVDVPHDTQAGVKAGRVFIIY